MRKKLKINLHTDSNYTLQPVPNLTLHSKLSVLETTIHVQNEMQSIERLDKDNIINK